MRGVHGGKSFGLRGTKPPLRGVQASANATPNETRRREHLGTGGGPLSQKPNPQSNANAPHAPRVAA